MPRPREVTVLPGAFKHCRKIAGLTQKELGALGGVSDTLVALIETGARQPSFVNAHQLGAAMGVEVEAFAFVHLDPAVRASIESQLQQPEVAA